MSIVRETIPFHPIFAALAKRIKKDEGINDANSKVALVNYAETLLFEIAMKSEQSIKDHIASKEGLKKSYGSMNWLSANFLGKLYTGLELRAAAKRPDGSIWISKLNKEQNTIFFEDALNLLSEAELIQFSEPDKSKISVTDKGKEYLAQLK